MNSHPPSARPGESRDPGVFFGAWTAGADEQKTWVPAFAGMSGGKGGVSCP